MPYGTIIVIANALTFSLISLNIEDQQNYYYAGPCRKILILRNEDKI